LVPDGNGHALDPGDLATIIATGSFVAIIEVLENNCFLVQRPTPVGADHPRVIADIDQMNAHVRDELGIVPEQFGETFEIAGDELVFAP
jgi:hypothetical protein